MLVLYIDILIILVLFQLLPAGTPVLKLLMGRFYGFRRPAWGDTFHRLSPNVVHRRKPKIP